MLEKAIPVALAGLLAASAPAFAETPANTLQELFHQLNQCMAPIEMAPDADVTLMFSLNRRGGLIGKPRMSHIHFTGDASAQARTAASLASAFDRCLPANITDALGGAIAGHIIAFRFKAPAAGERGA